LGDTMGKGEVMREAEEIPAKYAKWIWDLIDQLALARVRIKELEEEKGKE